MLFLRGFCLPNKPERCVFHTSAEMKLLQRLERKGNIIQVGGYD